MTLPVYITYAGRWSMLCRSISSLRRFGAHITVIDNTGGLLAARPPCGADRIVAADNAHKHLAPWELGLVPKDRWYVTTEEDVEVCRETPGDMVHALQGLIRRHDLPKAGLRIRTDDCPAIPRWHAALAHERAFDKRACPCCRATDMAIDTHFALHPPGTVEWPGIVGMRLQPPYECRHLPWYHAEFSDEELRYYAFAGEEWARNHNAAEAMA